MPKLDKVGLQAFFGGQSTDRKYGADFQFFYSRGIDFRKSPHEFTVLPSARKISGSVVVDLIEDMARLPSGEKLAVGDAGNLYRVNTNEEFSHFGIIGENGGAGITYRADVDKAYATGVDRVVRIDDIEDSPKLDQNWLTEIVSSSNDAFKTGGTSTYSVPTALNESDKREFVSDIEPFKKIGVKVVDKGTGDWTLTLHDDADNELGSVTLTNANLEDNKLNYFEFSSAVRALVSTTEAAGGRTYHFHLTSTVNDGTIQTTTGFSDCDLEVWAYPLVETKNGLHPVAQFANFTLIGNERYVATYEPLQDSPTTSDYQQHRLIFPPGYETTGFAQLDEYVLIGAEKRSDSGEFQEGKIFGWDSTSTTYNFFYDIPEGSPETLFSHKNMVKFIAGNALYETAGQQPVKVRTFRNTDSEYSDTEDITRVNPHMMTVRRGILLVGFPTSTTNQSLEHGVYSLGAISREFPDSWGFSYTISKKSEGGVDRDIILNDGSNNLRIGMIKNYGDSLFISWRHNNEYGVDIVDNSSDPAEFATLESLYFDNGEPLKKKWGFVVTATFDTLPSGTKLRLKYKRNKGSWVYSDWFDDSNTPDNLAKLNLETKDFYGIEFGADIQTTGTVTPEILSLFLHFDPQRKESEV